MSIDRHEEKTSPILRCILLLAALLLAAAAVFAAVSASSGRDYEGAQTLTDWEYVCGDRAAGLGLWSARWKTADREHPVKLTGDGDYLLIRGQVPEDAAYDSLCIRTANSVLSVKSGGQEVYSTMEDGRKLAGGRLNLIPLTELSGNRDVEILLYAPLAFTFETYLVDRADATTVLMPVPYLDYWLGGLMCLAGLALLLLLSRKSARMYRKSAARVLAAMFLIAGAAILANPVLCSRAASAPVWMFKFAMFLNILLPAAALIAVFAGKLPWNTKLEGIVGIDLLYAVMILLAPYELMAVYLIACCAILQAINLVAFFYLVRRFQVKLTPVSIASYLAFMAGNVFYWYSVSNHLIADFSFAMQCTAALCAGVAFVGLGYEGRAARREPAEKVEKVDTSLYLENVQALGEAVRTVAETPKMKEIVLRQSPTLVFGRAVGESEYLDALSKVVADKCDTFSHHLLHVAEYVYILCLNLGMSRERAMFVARASLLHDIGKIAVPRRILFKVEMLTDEEFGQIRMHTDYGYNMLSGSDQPFLQMAAKLAREHHERYDGSGYIGLRGEGIDYCARIVAVADVFDALTGQRTYKKIWRFDEAMNYIQEHAGDFFDPEIAGAFVACRKDIYRAYLALQEEQMHSEEAS